MFDFIKRKFRGAIIDPISDSVREKQEQLAETASEYAAPSVFYLLFAITGAVAVILVLLSLSLYIGQLLGSYLYGLFIFTSFFILLFLFVCAMRSRIETAVKKTVYELLKPSTDADVTIPLVEAEVLEETEVKRLEQH